jgi:hypothetical protein
MKQIWIVVLLIFIGSFLYNNFANSPTIILKNCYVFSGNNTFDVAHRNETKDLTYTIDKKNKLVHEYRGGKDFVTQITYIDEHVVNSENYNVDKMKMVINLDDRMIMGYEYQNNRLKMTLVPVKCEAK